MYLQKPDLIWLFKFLQNHQNSLSGFVVVFCDSHTSAMVWLLL